VTRQERAILVLLEVYPGSSGLELVGHSCGLLSRYDIYVHLGHMVERRLVHHYALTAFGLVPTHCYHLMRMGKRELKLLRRESRDRR
jgi:hypothetical protein